MIIEGLKFQFLTSEVFTRARDTIFAINCLISESHFTDKMCSFSVQNDKIHSEQNSIFVEVFQKIHTLLLYSKIMIGAYENV